MAHPPESGRTTINAKGVTGSMDLFAELKRRKVIKVGGAYLVVAWLIVQAASIGFPAFDAPPWALRVFIFVALLGFPISLVFAWVFDLTPDGEPELALQYLERASSDLASYMEWTMTLAVMDPIRCDPRFAAVIERLRTTDPHAPTICGKKS